MEGSSNGSQPRGRRVSLGRPSQCREPGVPGEPARPIRPGIKPWRSQGKPPLTGRSHLPLEILHPGPANRGSLAAGRPVLSGLSTGDRRLPVVRNANPAGSGPPVPPGTVIYVRVEFLGGPFDGVSEARTWG